MTAQAPAVILVGTQLAENIGMTARAMLNCGLTDLRLVRPRPQWPNERAVAAASGADVVLGGARIFDSTAAAIADLHYVYATTGRSREIVKPVVTGRAAAAEIHERAAREALSFRGHLSHPVGLAVHDVGDYRAGPLVPGIVFSVDPMLWVHEERLYVRMEDVVVVTETGVENFTEFMPNEIEEIEALMNEEGVLQMRPAESTKMEEKLK